MTRAHAEAQRQIAAPPERIYAVIADYRQGHPRILPPEHFRDLTVLAGGVGAGTKIRFRTRVGGREVETEAEISEPEPGRVLVERNTNPPATTTFTIVPVGDGSQARVKIETDWQTAPGVAGAIERMMGPLLFRRVYAKELARLVAVVER